MHYIGDKQQLGLGFDLSSGGAISSLRYKRDELVNSSDKGREIQMALWDLSDTYKDPLKGPYGWNPIQAGDIFGNGATVLEADLSEDHVLIKAIGKQYGQRNVDADVIFTTEAWHRGDYFEVRIAAKYTGADYHPASIQEVPAVFVQPTLIYRVRYIGNAPFTGAAIEMLKGKPACSADTLAIPTENWLGYAKKDRTGLIIALPPGQLNIAVWQQCFPWRGGYIAPWGNFDVSPDTTRKVHFYLIPGPIDKGRSIVYQLVGPN